MRLCGGTLTQRTTRAHSGPRGSRALVRGPRRPRTLASRRFSNKRVTSFYLFLRASFFHAHSCRSCGLCANLSLDLPQKVPVVSDRVSHADFPHRLGRLRSQDADRVNTRSDRRRGSCHRVLDRNAVLGLEPKLPHGGKVGLRVRLGVRALGSDDYGRKVSSQANALQNHQRVWAGGVRDGGGGDPTPLDPTHQLPQALHGLDLRFRYLSKVRLLVDDPLFGVLGTQVW
mmetsp:Transcript_10345/g.35705  ORF Transcript_10345/g.35705 Transcript_10345/m.35705 type:complete len:229 (-) Transcript_10345:554-1240(-)